MNLSVAKDQVFSLGNWPSKREKWGFLLTLAGSKRMLEGQSQESTGATPGCLRALTLASGGKSPFTSLKKDQ